SPARGQDGKFPFSSQWACCKVSAQTPQIQGKGSPQCSRLQRSTVPRSFGIQHLEIAPSYVMPGPCRGFAPTTGSPGRSHSSRPLLGDGLCPEALVRVFKAQGSGCFVSQLRVCDYHMRRYNIHLCRHLCRTSLLPCSASSPLSCTPNLCAPLQSISQGSRALKVDMSPESATAATWLLIAAFPPMLGWPWPWPHHCHSKHKPAPTSLALRAVSALSHTRCHPPSTAVCAPADALRGPRLVSGEPGGLVTIQCHYAPLVINRLQRKYCCRLRPPAWICHTVVSTNHYTDLRYRGRVALTDFPQRGLFVVTLSQLSLDDGGHYRCGMGNRNNELFFNMHLTISAGSSSAIPTVTPAAGDLVMGPFGKASPAVSTWTQGPTPTTEGQGAGWGRVLTPQTSKTTVSAKGRQTPGTSGRVVPGPGGWVEHSIRATAPIQKNPVSKSRGTSNTTEGVLPWSTKSTVVNSSKEGGRKTITTEASKSREAVERVAAALDTAWKVTGTFRPSMLVSEIWAQEILQEVTSVSKPKALASVKGSTPTASVWTSGPTKVETASVEGSAAGDLDPSAGDRSSRATPSHNLVAGKGSSVKR
ncbi:High affinity immunoglobulin alpha and immunoglobulin mu Fc receptor, partial [Galemys pyrenaicus]